LYPRFAVYIEPARPREHAGKSTRRKRLGAILSDHLENLDWGQRQATKAGKIPRAILGQARARVAALLENFLKKRLAARLDSNPCATLD